MSESGPVIDFYFDFISPYSYLTATRLDAFSREHNARFVWLPVNLPKLIKLSGNTPPTMIRNKAIYSLRDLKRWTEFLKVPFRMIRPGSFDSRPAMRIALDGDDRARFSLAVFEAIWSGRIDPIRPDWLQQVAAQYDLSRAWLKRQDDRLEQITVQALEAGAFGVPTFICSRTAQRNVFRAGSYGLSGPCRRCDKPAPAQLTIRQPLTTSMRRGTRITSPCSRSGSA